MMLFGTIFILLGLTEGQDCPGWEYRFYSKFIFNTVIFLWVFTNFGWCHLLNIDDFGLVEFTFSYMYHFFIVSPLNLACVQGASKGF